MNKPRKETVKFKNKRYIRTNPETLEKIEKSKISGRKNVLKIIEKMDAKIWWKKWHSKEKCDVKQCTKEVEFIDVKARRSYSCKTHKDVFYKREHKTNTN